MWITRAPDTAAAAEVHSVPDGRRTALTASDPTRRVLIQLAVALGGLVAVAEVLVADGPLRAIYPAYLFPALGALYVATGILTWWRRPGNQLGSLMTACGAATVVTSYANTAVPMLIAAGAVTATLPLSVLIHIVHACPTGVVRGRAAKITVAAAYVAGLVLQVPIWAFTPQPPPFDVVLVSPRPDLADTGAVVQKAFGAVVVVATLVLLGRRLREYGRADRRLLAGLLGFAVLAVLTAAIGGNVLPALGIDVKAVVDVQIAAVAIVPLGLLLVVLRGGFTRPGELAAFAGTAGSAVGSPGASREFDRTVADALGDPTAVLLRWDRGGYVDGAGRPAVPVPGPHRAVVAIGPDDAPLGALVHDTALGTDRVLLGAVVQVAAIALERERLAREVIDSRAELREASLRVLAAGDAERRRIARDLHDGLQGALVLLALQAGQLADGPPGEPPDDLTRRSAVRLVDGVDAVARRVRDLVAGVLPSPLVERGLPGAVRDLVEGLPLPASVSVHPPDLELPTAVETTAYFVIAEATTNVLKHACAGRAVVTIRLDDGVLVLEVVDDGVGSDAYVGGTGLAGLRDRVSIFGGTVEVTSAGSGTTLLARLPCA